VTRMRIRPAACCATCSASPDVAELARAEAAPSASRLIDLERRRLPGRYDLAHLQAFHRYIPRRHLRLGRPAAHRVDREGIGVLPAAAPGVVRGGRVRPPGRRGPATGPSAWLRVSGPEGRSVGAAPPDTTRERGRQLRGDRKHSTEPPAARRAGAMSGIGGSYSCLELPHPAPVTGRDPAATGRTSRQWSSSGAIPSRA